MFIARFKNWFHSFYRKLSKFNVPFNRYYEELLREKEWGLIEGQRFYFTLKKNGSVLKRFHLTLDLAIC